MNIPNQFLLLLLILGLLAWFQNRLHREVQLIFLIITRNSKLAILLFSLVFLPGVFLHELSHLLVAKLLRVPTGRFSLIPKDLKDGRLQLGFVEVAATDPIRESLIGAAPLLAGGGFVAYAGFSRLGMDAVWLAGIQQGFSAGSSELAALFDQPDVWLWFYLTLAVSSTMFPSNSDRRPMYIVGVGLVVVLGAVLAFGAGYWLLDLLGPGLARALGAAALIFGISAGLHLLALIPLALIRWLLVQILKIEIRMA